MNIQELPLDQIIPYADNPRDNTAAIDAVAASINSFGFNVPLVLDREHVIITGHTRFKAAQKLGLQKVPCIIAEHLSDDRARAYRLADNKVSELASWNDTLLRQELDALEEIGIDMSEFGFADDLDDQSPENIIEDEPPEEAEPITRPGDLYQLGRHRLLCGDSTRPEAIRALTRGEKIDLLLTDPPYNVDYTGATADELKIQNDSMDRDEFFNFLTAAFRAADGALKPGAAIYIWHASGDNAPIFYRAFENTPGWELKQQLVWVKNTMVLGRMDYQYKHEPCIYGVKAGARRYFTESRNEVTVVEDRPNLTQMGKPELIALCKELLNRPFEGSSVLREDKPNASHQHPTMKPVKLFARLILNSSRKGERILDTFAGSGTAAIAAEQLSRTAYLMEMDPIYCDRIIKRWEDMTGEKAHKL